MSARPFFALARTGGPAVPLLKKALGRRVMKSVWRLASVIAFGCVCGVGVYRALAEETPPTPAAVPTPVAAPTPAAADSGDKGDGKYAPGDLVFVEVYRHPELSTTAMVDPHGSISLSYVGSIPLAGLTDTEASARVSMEMSKVIKSPRVTVSRSKSAPRGAARASEMALEIIPLHNSSAEALSKTLQGMSSEGGSISADSSTNTLIVTDSPSAIRNIQSVIARLDEMQNQLTQVRIEAKIAEVHNGAMKELGIKWFAQGDKLNAGYNPMRTQDPSLNALRGQSSVDANEVTSNTAAGTTGRRFLNDAKLDRRLNIPVQVPSVGQFFTGYFNKGIDIGAMLDALVADKKAQLLASPMIVTVNHKTADIKMVDEYPYTNLTTDLGGRSNYLTQFMPVGIRLSVTPHVLKDEAGGYVKLEMEPEVSFSNGSSNGVPIRSLRSSHSVANVRSGQTVVIGGIYSDDSQDSENRVPGLGKIPVIQHFFKHTEKTKTRTELMVFVTPTVFESPEQVTWDKMVEVNGMPAKDAPTFQAPQARAEARRD